MDDVIIIGGSFAGLIAASHLVRARRKVTIFDTNRPRNRYARAAHNVLGYDGVSPLDIRRKALVDVLAYPTARPLSCSRNGPAISRSSPTASICRPAKKPGSSAAASVSMRAGWPACCTTTGSSPLR